MMDIHRRNSERPRCGGRWRDQYGKDVRLQIVRGSMAQLPCGNVWSQVPYQCMCIGVSMCFWAY